MGHIAGGMHAYGVLQERLKQKVQSVTESPVLMKLLTLLFTPDQAEIAAKMPHSFATLETLSQRTGMPQDELRGRLDEMADQGLVFDIEHKGRNYYVLPPVVIGLFEFTFMRLRPNMPMKELAELFDEYFTENDFAFAHNLFAGSTQPFRAFVREEAIPAANRAEVLDYERAARVIADSSSMAVGTCQCHHLARHRGSACDKPEEICMTFGFAADGLVRHGIARRVTKDEGMALLLRCKEHGLAQIGDNVRNKVTFICNCCRCCCHVIGAIRACDLHPGIVTSNFIMETDPARCSGCGKCAAACPVSAVTMEETAEGAGRKGQAVRHAASCMGCGVCTTVCPSGAAAMRSRGQRVLVPEDAFEQRVTMAIERGKLADLVFDDPGRLGHRALGRVLGALERSGPARSWLTAQSLNSAFLRKLAKAARKRAGDLGDLIA